MKKRVQVLLAESEIESLSNEAKEKGLSLSSMIRVKLKASQKIKDYTNGGIVDGDELKLIK